MNSFVAFFIERKITSLMLFLSVILSGLLALWNTPTSLMPPTEKKGLTISISYPGQSPFRIERIITKPVEQGICEVGGIDSLVSMSQEGESKIYVTFKDDVDMKYKIVEIREKIDPIRAMFPRDVHEPSIYGYNSDDKPVMIITVTSSEIPIDELREIAEKRLKKIFERIEGVSEVAIGGGIKREIGVFCHDDRLVSHGINFRKINSALHDNNISLPLGTCGIEKEYTIYLDEKYRTIDDIKSTPILTTKVGSVVSLDQIADVRDYAGTREDISRIDGIENVSLFIQKVGTANIINVCRDIRKEIDTLKNNKIKTVITYDQSEYIENSLSDLIESCIIGMILSSVVLFIFFKSFKNAFPVMLAIPFSLLSVFIYMYLNNITINIISLSGLAIATGMVVDNGIVILANIRYRIEEKKQKPTIRLFIESTAEMSKAIFASTLASICIFIPILLFSDNTRSMYSDMAGTIIVALASSFILAVTLIPSMSSYLYQVTYRGTARFKGIKKIVSLCFETIRLFKIYRILYSNYQKVLTIIEKRPSYRTVMLWAFSNQKKIYITLIILLALSVAGGILMRKEYIEPFEKSEVYASIDVPSGTNLEETSRLVKDVEQSLKQDASVKSISAKIEKWHADLIIRLKKNHTGASAVQSLKKRVSHNQVSGVFVFFEEDRSNESSNELDIEITGPDIQQIRTLARKLSSLLAGMAEVDDVVLRFKEGRPEFAINIQQHKAALNNLSSGEIGDYVRSAIFGPVATKFIDMGEVDIRARLSSGGNDFFESISYMPIITNDKKTLPLGEIADFEETVGITTIWRKDKVRMESITVKLKTGDLENFSIKAKKEIDAIHIPQDYHVDFGESLKKMTDSRKEMYSGILIAILLVFMVVAGIFESFILPLIIIIAIPLAAIGVFLTLIVFGKSLNLSIYMGLIILVGIVVNNAIVLIDTIEKNKTKGTINDEDIIESAKSRIHPIMMTTLTTSLGLLPLLFGGSEGSIWRGFSMTVISGLAFSSVLVLVLIPTVYRDIFNRRSQ